MSAGLKITSGNTSLYHLLVFDHLLLQRPESEFYSRNPLTSCWEHDSNEDDLTAKLAEIVNYNNTLALMMDLGRGIEMISVSR